ncbi:hypothetical protein Pcinc_042384 [Petrolisthes cinctipes]|uniref:Uncharacterized protein n=1 Tax=Petrolisthes cinctipes TaxID=88211 RepID=A0AAE1EH25_PETCI|nr:hypothetical protein Pcinc_042384 [Petrolisthes cinctipes]
MGVGGVVTAWSGDSVEWDNVEWGSGDSVEWDNVEWGSGDSVEWESVEWGQRGVGTGREGLGLVKGRAGQGNKCINTMETVIMFAGTLSSVPHHGPTNSSTHDPTDSPSSRHEFNVVPGFHCILAEA